MSDIEYLNGLYRTRNQYRTNAEHALSLGEYRKSSELLWGALTQQLKALAAIYGIVITSHRQFFDFLRQLAADLNDRLLYEDFIALNALHKNFYDEIIPLDAFPDFYQRALAYIVRLETLALAGNP